MVLFWMEVFCIIIKARGQRTAGTGSRWQTTIDDHSACPAWRQMGCSSGGPQWRLRRVSSSLSNVPHKDWWQLLKQQNSCVALMKWTLCEYCCSVAPCDLWHLDQINKGKKHKSLHLEILIIFCLSFVPVRTLLALYSLLFYKQDTWKSG